jgi:hypothetical protein
MIKFQRTLFENSYKSICMIQEQTEQMVAGMWNMFPWLPDESRKILDDTIRSSKNAREDFKKVVDEGFDKIEETFVRQ